MKSRNVLYVMIAFAIAISAGCGSPDDPTQTPGPGAAPTLDTQATATPEAAAPTESSTDLPAPRNDADTIHITVNEGAGDRAPNPAGGLNSAFHNLVTVRLSVAESLVTTRHGQDGPELQLPWLATDWEVAPDLSHVRFNIQEGVQFHDGYGELTAEDVAWNVNQANARVTPDSVSGVAGSLNMWGEWEAEDDYTVFAPVEEWDPTWYASGLGLAQTPLPMWSKEAYEDLGRDHFVATGPFQVREWVVDDRIVLDAVDDHWRQSPHVSQIRVVAVAEATTRHAMLLNGQTDMSDAALADTPSLTERGFVVGGSRGGSEINLVFAGNYWEEHDQDGQPLESPGFDPTKPWVGDPTDEESMENARLVRHALSMAIDRDLIAQTIGAGVAWPSYVGWWNPEMPQWQDKWEVPYDPDGARELLEEAGYSDGFDVSVFGQSGHVRAEIAQATSDFWRQIGLSVEVISQPYETFRPALVDRSADLPHLNSCSDGRVPRPWDWPVGMTHSSLSRGGFGCGVEDPFVTETRLAVAAEQDLDERIRLSNELVDHMHHWMHTAGVISVPQYVLYNPRAIESWDARPGSTINSLEAIVPATR